MLLYYRTGRIESRTRERIESMAEVQIMGETNWLVLDWEPDTISGFIAQAEQGRQVLNTGAGMLTAVGADIENELTILISQNWSKWQESDLGGWHQVDPADLRGTIGNVAVAREARAIARRITRPFRQAAQMQDDAARALTRVRPLMRKHLAPLDAPARAGRSSAGRLKYQAGERI